MKRSFRKISRVGSLTGGTRWYLNNDCLLAAKRRMYVVEYRRFYLRDLECIVVWPSRFWLWRVTIPAALLALLAASLWYWANSMAGQTFTAISIAWVLLELALGPTARSRVHTTGGSVDLPLVKRTRRAHKVLAKIDAAVRASRDVGIQASIHMPDLPVSGGSVAMKSEAASPAAPLADASHTNGF